MKLYSSLLCLLVLSCGLFGSDENSFEGVPTRGLAHNSFDKLGLLAPQFAKPIKPTDFNAGTVVITEPGYYFLTGDVTFCPRCPYTLDENGKPWPAAVLILSDHVTFDLNNHSIQQKRTDFNDPPSPYYSEYFKVFALGGTNILDRSDATHYTPKSITIKNGTIGGSQGYGIYGKDNVDVTVYDVTICQCDIAGIFLQNLKCSALKNICVAGSSYSTGQSYGIFLRDNSTTSLEWTSSGDGTSGPSAVEMDNIKICDIYTNSTLDPLNFIQHQFTCVRNNMSVIELTDAANASGVTGSVKAAAEDLLTAIDNLKTSITTAIDTTNLANVNDITVKAGIVTTEVADVVAVVDGLGAGATSQDELVKSAAEDFTIWVADVTQAVTEALAVLNTDVRDYIDGTLVAGVWHAYGIRVVQGSSISLRNCAVTGTNVIASLPTATRATGIALDKCEGVLLNDCSTNTSFVNLGSSIGYSVANISKAIVFEHCVSTDHLSNDKTYGFWMRQAHGQKVENCESSSHVGVSQSRGFYLEYCSANAFEGCKSYNHSCVLALAGDAAKVIGFDSVAGNCNWFKKCEAYNMVADSGYANSSYSGDLLAAGFRLRSYPDSDDPVVTQDKDGVITECISRCHEGSAGDAVGILLDNAVCSTVTKNHVATNSSNKRTSISPDVFEAAGNGYGIWDTLDDTLALILQNFAYANQTMNYKVSYSLENEVLPVVDSTYGDMTSVFVASEWENVSLHPNPGAPGCVAACSSVPEYTP